MSRRIIVLCVVALVLGAGCSDDPTKLDSGTINVACQPDSLTAAWTLEGPNTLLEFGAGAATLKGMPAGEYTLTWDGVAGWSLLDVTSVTSALSAGSEITFLGVFEFETGTILIDSDPEELAAGWVLTGPTKTEQSGLGDATLEEMPAGEYTLTWDDMAGWNSPDAATRTLLPDSTVVFAGTYGEIVLLLGSIVIDPSPGHVPAPWNLTGPDGYIQQGTGQETLHDLPAGEYTLDWGDVSGWTTPPGSSLVLMADSTVTFNCTYVEIPPERGTVVIDPSPDSINAPWSINGPANYTGNGDTTLPDLPVGEYTLTWGEVGGWIEPLRETATLTADGTLTFSGLYEEQLAGFAYVAAGSFEMGSPEDEPGRGDDETGHEVTLTRSFFVLAKEITNQQFMDLAQWAVDNGYATVTPSSLRDALDGSTAELLDLNSGHCEIRYQGGVFSCENPDRPVLEVPWYGAAAYCDWLNMFSDLVRSYDHSNWACNGGDPYSAVGYRLPTEAEWEVACRSGSTTAFANGQITDQDCNDPALDKIGWYCGNADYRTHRVAQKSPNAWGLYDLHGNLSEWCNDWYDEYPGDVTDPVGPAQGTHRVLRGGYWGAAAAECRSAARHSENPVVSHNNIGFRMVRSAD